MKHFAILILLAGSLAAYSQTQQPERVCLSEVLISSPETDTPAQVNEARLKAEWVRNSAQMGGSFSDLARANSQGPSAARGGAIGCFKRGQLSKQLEDRVFDLRAGEVSDPLRTKQGFVVLQACCTIGEDDLVRRYSFERDSIRAELRINRDHTYSESFSDAGKSSSSSGSWKYWDGPQGLTLNDVWVPVVASASKPTRLEKANFTFHVDPCGKTVCLGLDDHNELRFVGK